MIAVRSTRTPKLRDALLALEGAVVELHAAEEKAAGRLRERPGDTERARALFLEAKAALEALRGKLTVDERARATALLDTVALLLAVREAIGEASIASRLLS